MESEPRELRKTCPACQSRPVAINCHKGKKTYYRPLCDTCLRRGLNNQIPPGWVRAGYQKKPHCELCGFKAKIAEQLLVFYMDGNLRNNNWVNLKTICQNCSQEVYKSRVQWKKSPLAADF